MKYDFFMAQKAKKSRIIDAYLSMPIHPWIFSKLDAETIIRIFIGYCIGTNAEFIVVKPKINVDLTDLCEMLKEDLKLLGEIDVTEGIDGLKHFARIHKCITRHSYSLPDEVYPFSSILDIDGTDRSSELLDKFIQYSMVHENDATEAMLRDWTETLEELLDLKLIESEIFTTENLK